MIKSSPSALLCITILFLSGNQADAVTAQSQASPSASATASAASTLVPTNASQPQASASASPSESSAPTALPTSTPASFVPAASPSKAPVPRVLPPPLDPIFPSADFPGPTVGEANDTTVYSLQKHLFPKSDGTGIRVYGWFDPGVLLSTSKHSTYPMTYNTDPNMVNLDQLILRFERQPDTTQTKHADWGFRLSNLYGVDYRWTTAQGYFSNQLLGTNQLYGYDPVEAYGILYSPRLGQGTSWQIGRYISPPDIEAQLAPNNFLYTHSIFFDFDAYTQTGILAQTKMSNYWTLLYGVNAGSDMAPWAKSSRIPTAQLLARWVSHANKDSVLFGVNSINAGGKFTSYTLPNGTLAGHDDLQQENITWTHVFNPKFQNQFETYYLYSYNAYQGGTINNGPVKFGGGGGAGAFLPGLSVATGAVDYLERKISTKAFLSFRTDYMNDQSGWRSGFPTSYGSLTLGTTYRPSALQSIRPEIRYEQAFANGVTPYDNGTKKTQTSFEMDFIQFF